MKKIIIVCLSIVLINSCKKDQNNKYSDYYCITGISSIKLEVLGDVKCGKNEIIEKFNNIN